MKNIEEDLKSGRFLPAYLLYGEEEYLLLQYKERLLKALTDGCGTLNFARYEGKDINVQEIIDLAETIPFLSERRVILLENTGWFKNKCDEMADYLKEMPDYLYLIFCEQQVDKRSRMFKAVRDKGRAAEFQMPDDRTLTRWIGQVLAKNGRKISAGNAEELLVRTGSDMGNIRNELEKLISYTEGRGVVLLQDIEAVCTTRTVNRVFDMVRAAAEKKPSEAMALYEDLLTLREPPLRILFLMARQFRQMMLTKKMEKEGRTQQEIAKALGIQPFAVRRLSSCARSYGNRDLEALAAGFAEAEEDVKSGRLDERLAVELMIITCSR